MRKIKRSLKNKSSVTTLTDRCNKTLLRQGIERLHKLGSDYHQNKNKKSKDFKKIFLSTGLALAFSISLTGKSFAQIVPDGRTDTVVTPVGPATNEITTGTVSGINAFNSFSQFNINSGETANLILPTGTENLINTVSNGTSNIQGILNAFKDGQIGGNVFLLNPQGIMVSQTGVINVGSLTALTPTQNFVDNFYNAPGVPNEESVAALLSGTVPINQDGVIINQGEIYAPLGVDITAGCIANTSIISTATNNFDLDNNLGVLVNLTSDEIYLTEGSQIIAPNAKVALNRLSSGDIIISRTQELDTIEAESVVIGNNGKTNNIKTTVDLDLDKSLELFANENIKTENISTLGPLVLKSRGGDIITGNLKATLGDNETIDDLISLRTRGEGKISTKNITALVGSNNIINGNLIGLFSENGDIKTENILLKVESNNEGGGIGSNDEWLEMKNRANIETCDIDVYIKDNNDSQFRDIISLGSGGFNLKTGNINVDIGDNNELESAVFLNPLVNIDAGNIYVNIGNDNWVRGLIQLSIIDENIKTKDLIIKTGQNNDLVVGITMFSALGDITSGNIVAKLGENNTVTSRTVALEAGTGNIEVKDIFIDHGETEIIDRGAIAEFSADSFTARNILVNNQTEDPFAIGADEDVKIKNIGIIGPLSITSDGGDIKIGNIFSKLGDNKTIDDLILLETADAGNISTKSITALVGSNNNIGSVINIDTSAGNLRNGNITAILGDNNTVGQVIFESTLGDITNGNITAKLGDNNNIDSSVIRLSGGSNGTNDNLTALLGNDNRVNGNVIGLDIAGNIKNKDITANLKDNNSVGSNVISVNSQGQGGTGSITNSNVTAKLGNKNTVGNNVIDTFAGGDLQNKNVIAKLGDHNAIGNYVIHTNTIFGDVTNEDITAQIGNNNSVTRSVIDTVARNRLKNGNLTAKLGNKNDIGNNVIRTSASEKATIGDITAILGDDNNIVLNVYSGFTGGDINNGNITTVLGDRNISVEGAVVSISAGNDNTNGNIIAKLGNDNSVTNTISVISSGGDIKNGNITAEYGNNNEAGAVVIQTGTIIDGNVTNGDLTTKLGNNNSVGVYIIFPNTELGDITNGNITTLLGDNNAVGNDAIYTVSAGEVINGDVTAKFGKNNTLAADLLVYDDFGGSVSNTKVKDIRIDIGENTIHNKTLAASTKNFKAGNITINSKTNGSVYINARENIETGNIVSNAKIDSNITLLAENNVLTNNLLAWGDILIAKNNTPEKANKVKTENILLGGDLEIVANEIETQNILAGGTVTLTDDNSITTQNILALDDITLSSSGTITTQNIFTGKNLTAGNITNGAIEKAEQISTKNIKAENNVTLAANEVKTGTISAGGTIIIIED